LPRSLKKKFFIVRPLREVVLRFQRGVHRRWEKPGPAQTTLSQPNFTVARSSRPLRLRPPPGIVTNGFLLRRPLTSARVSSAQRLDVLQFAGKIGNHGGRIANGTRWNSVSRGCVGWTMLDRLQDASSRSFCSRASRGKRIETNSRICSLMKRKYTGRSRTPHLLAVYHR
jgi:hypothetical protein